MRMTRFVCIALVFSVCLTGCGYKGNLYLPKENDQTRFGVIQTGLSIEPINPQNLPSHD